MRRSGQVRQWAAAALVACGIWAAGTAAAGPRDCRLRLCDKGALTEEPFTRADVELELRVGREVAARILSRFRLVPDARLQRYVNRVGAVLARNASRPELEYRFAVIDTATANAFSTPGGYVFVTRGALEAMESEAELAAVLAHEIAHVDRRHVVRDLRIRAPKGGLEGGVARLVGAGTGPVQVAFRQAVEGTLGILFQRGYRVEQEREADQVALMILAHTGYRPQALARYLGRLRNRRRGRIGHLARTHPLTPERLAAIRRVFPEDRPIGIELRARFGRYVDFR